MTEKTRPPDKYQIAFDRTLMRPGCINLQAIYCGERLARPEFLTMFKSEHWLVSPTPDLRVYSITIPQMKQLAQMLEKPC